LTKRDPNCKIEFLKNKVKRNFRKMGFSKKKLKAKVYIKLSLVFKNFICTSEREKEVKSHLRRNKGNHSKV